MRHLNPFALEESKPKKRKSNPGLGRGLAIAGGVAVVGTAAYLIYRAVADDGGTSVESSLAKYYSATRREVPETAFDAKFPDDLRRDAAKQTYAQYAGLNLSRTAQELGLSDILAAQGEGLDDLEAALKAAAERFSDTKLAEYYRMQKARLGPVTVELTPQLEKIWSDFHKLAIALRAGIEGEVIDVDSDPVGPGDKKATCAGTLALLKTGVVSRNESTGIYTAKAPAVADPNVELRQTYSIRVEDMKSYLGAMAMTHEAQLEAFAILYGLWADAYERGIPDELLAPVGDTAEAIAPDCGWDDVRTYTPDMVVVWNDLKKLSDLAQEIAVRDLAEEG